MAVVIDGTTGISTPAEAVAGNLSYTGTLTGGTGVINLGSGQVYKDASGNVGIGTSSPASYGKLAVVGDITFASASAALRNVGTFTMINDLGSNGVNVGNSGTGAYLKFQTAIGDAARILSAGDFLFGKTTADVTSAGIQFEAGLNYGRFNFTKAAASGTGATPALAFYYAGTGVGQITNTSTGTAYVTTSDYRLKEDVAPMTGALAKVAALNPVTYKWKSDGSDSQGFIAHELQAVVPDCVVGEKDAVDAEGNPQYQGIDTSFLVATLAAAIQELKAIVDAQATRITALEGAAA